MATARVRTTRDFNLILKLDRGLFGAGVALPRQEHTWWVATIEGEVAAYAGLGVYRDEGGYVFLSRVGVLPAYRGRGLQRLLIRIREREARRLGIRVALTYTARWNVASANNLIKCGYVLYRPHYKWGCEEALYFWKDL